MFPVPSKVMNTLICINKTYFIIMSPKWEGYVVPLSFCSWFKHIKLPLA